MAHPNARYSTAERFEMKVDRSGECHRWIAGHDSYGYGSFRLGRVIRKAHHVALELAGITVPAGLTVDHVWARGCRHRDCVRLEHLEIVPMTVNVMRGRSPAAENARKTHCIHGHRFPEEPGAGGRRCLVCVAERAAVRDQRLPQREWREKREAANPALREARLERARQYRARLKQAS